MDIETADQKKNAPNISEIKKRDIDSVLKQSNLKQFKSNEQNIINHERVNHLQVVRKAVDELKV